MPPFDDDRIGRLEAATERLSQNVVGLSTSLSLVTEITKRQSELEARATRSEVKAEEVAKTAVNKDFLTKQQLIYRRAIMQRVTGFAIAGVLLLLAISTAAINYDNGRRAVVRKQELAVYKVCVGRIAQSAALQKYLSEQAAIETTNKFIDDTIRAKRLASYEELARAYSNVDCSGVKPK